MKLLTREPVLCVALLSAVLTLLGACGVDLSPEAQAGVAGLLTATLALLRATVTPAARAEEAVDLAAGIAARSVARNITPDLAGAAGHLGETSGIIADAVEVASATLRR